MLGRWAIKEEVNVGEDKIVYSMRAFLLGLELPFMQQMTGGKHEQSNTN